MPSLWTGSVFFSYRCFLFLLASVVIHDPEREVEKGWVGGVDYIRASHLRLIRWIIAVVHT
jgi:hypothetical protein